MDEVKGIRIVSLTGKKEYGIEDSGVREKLANVVDGAPEELDSFKEAFDKFKEGGEALATITESVERNAEAVTTEITRAKAAEAALSEAITGEVSRAQGAERALAENIDTEQRRATAAEEELGRAITEESKRVDAEIAKEAARAEAAEQTNANAISNEAARATQAEIDAVEQGRKLALRALFVAAGAEYNDTDQDIVKYVKIPSWSTYGEWINEPVTHKAHCYRVGVVGDLTEYEMLTVYNSGKWWDHADCNGFTLMSRASLLPTSHLQTFYKNYQFNQFCNGNKVMSDLCLSTLTINEKVTTIKLTTFQYWGQSSIFKRIIGVFDLTYVTGNMGFNPPNLEYCNFIKLKKNLSIQFSPNISKDSLKYMIVNAIPTAAITITIHADAYARLADDADIVAALAAQPLITLVSA